jgi:hypothetical protein
MPSKKKQKLTQQRNQNTTNRKVTTAIQYDENSNNDGNEIPIGTKVSKLFNNGRVYKGEVISYDRKRKWYQTKYDDDMVDDMTLKQIQKYINDVETDEEDDEDDETTASASDGTGKLLYNAAHLKGVINAVVSVDVKHIKLYHDYKKKFTDNLPVGDLILHDKTNVHCRILHVYLERKFRGKNVDVAKAPCLYYQMQLHDSDDSDDSTLLSINRKFMKIIEPGIDFVGIPQLVNQSKISTTIFDWRNMSVFMSNKVLACIILYEHKDDWLITRADPLLQEFTSIEEEEQVVAMGGLREDNENGRRNKQRLYKTITEAIIKNYKNGNIVRPYGDEEKTREFIQEYKERDRNGDDASLIHNNTTTLADGSVSHHDAGEVEEDGGYDSKSDEDNDVGDFTAGTPATEGHHLDDDSDTDVRDGNTSTTTTTTTTKKKPIDTDSAAAAAGFDLELSSESSEDKEPNSLRDQKKPSSAATASEFKSDDNSMDIDNDNDNDNDNDRVVVFGTDDDDDISNEDESTRSAASVARASSDTTNIMVSAAATATSSGSYGDSTSSSIGDVSSAVVNNNNNNVGNNKKRIHIDDPDDTDDDTGNHNKRRKVVKDVEQQKRENRGNIGDDEEEVEGDDNENNNNDDDDDALTVTAQHEEEGEEDNRSSTDDPLADDYVATSANNGHGNNDVDISVDHNSDNNYFLKAKQEARVYLLAKFGQVNEEEEIALV